MTEAKHTPGPWKATQDSVVDLAGSIICEAAPTGISPKTELDWLANARLIAAAPDMLALVTVLLGHDDRFQVALGGNPLAVDKLLASARITYAKAIGAA